MWYVRREGSRWRPAFIVAAACSDTEAGRGEAVGESVLVCTEPSPLAAMVLGI